MALIIDGTTFKMPSSIVRDDNRRELISTTRAIDNTLIASILSFTEKNKRTLTWNILTNNEVNFLKSKDQNGFYTVQITDTGYEYNATSLIRMSAVNENYATYKSNISVTIEEV